MEWLSEYNPFNSRKAMVWRETFEALARGLVPPPIAVTIDPTNRCNLSCVWCKYDTWRKTSMVDAPAKPLRELPLVLSGMGVKAVCIAGGGEPLLCDNTATLIGDLKRFGMRVSVITNGTHISKRTMEALVACDWVGVSVDAGTSSTYVKLKGGKEPSFLKVLNNINRMAGMGVKVGYKYLLHPANIAEVGEGIHLAKQMGARWFHARPVYLPESPFDKESISTAWKLIDRGRRMLAQEGRFEVFGVRHKFSPTWTPNIPFERCRVTPIGGTVFAADGGVYLCCDNRGLASQRLCSWAPDPHEFARSWGSDGHRSMMDAIDVSRCGRCTYAEYGVILREVFERGSMDYHFV